jgi:5'-nucleotidase / UDP-sugar diphosphatase
VGGERLKRTWIVLALAAVLNAPGSAQPAGQTAPQTAAESVGQEPGPRNGAPVTFLQLNDVYSVVPIDGLGGLARVATQKQQLAATGHRPFLVMAGDFLSPSVASSVFKGEQMIAALNAAGLDLATLGNHEFDFGDDVLIQRMREARFEWVVSNVIDSNTGQPIGGAAPYLVKSFGPLKVGFLGLCLNSEEITPDKLKHTRIIDPIAAAGQHLPALKRAGADLIVAITHLAFAADRALVERYPEIDVVIGGHEHFLITAVENRTLISKAGSDARTVARIDLNKQPNGTVERFYELLPMNSAIADEPRTAAVIASFESRLSSELEKVVATTRVPLDAVASHLRTSETNLGNLVADAIRAEAGAELAIVNSGSIRGNRVFPAGPLTRRTLIEMQPFDNVVVKVATPGRVVLRALNLGVERLPAPAGMFPQVSGLKFTVDAKGPAGNRIRDVQVNGQPLEPDRTYTVAIPDYVLLGGDSYTMFADQRVLVSPEAGTMISTALEKYVTAQREITQGVEGRIIVR